MFIQDKTQRLCINNTKKIGTYSAYHSLRSEFISRSLYTRLSLGSVSSVSIRCFSVDLKSLRSVSMYKFLYFSVSFVLSRYNIESANILKKNKMLFIVCRFLKLIKGLHPYTKVRAQSGYSSIVRYVTS